jgi:subtilisin-like proprotein convertase family protein
VLTSTLMVSGAGPYLFDLDLTTQLTHTFARALDITLTTPAGTVVTLTTDNKPRTIEILDFKEKPRP